MVSHTYCDTEMRALEELGMELEIDVAHPPRNAFRHGQAARLRAPIYYAPPAPVLKARELRARREGRFPEELVRDHLARFGAAFKPAERARNALHFAATLPARGVTHLHAHFANRAAHTALFISALSGLPFSFTAHGQDFMADLGSRELLCEMCARAAFIVVVSEYSRTALLEMCPAAEPKLHRIYNGMELANFPVTTRLDSAAPRLLSVARLVPLKGHLHLIEACARLRARGLAFSCEIVGDGPERPTLGEAIERAGLQDQVRLTGALPQEEVIQKFAACDLFVLPSFVDERGATDILPTVILEAMASARAVVASRVGGVAEMIEDGKNGVLVPPGDAGALAEALAPLLADGELRRKLGAQGRGRVEQEFQSATAARHLQRLFEQHAGAAARDSQAAGTPGFAYVIARWPAPELPTLRAELKALRQRHPGLRAMVIALDPLYIASLQDEPLLEWLEFLPDAIVQEGEWLQEREIARRVETWCQQLSIGSEEFLRQARWALQLRRELRESGIRLLQFAGATALPCAWILKKLCGHTYSASIEPRPELPGPLLRELVAGSVGGRLVQKRGDTAWPPTYEYDQPARLRWWPFGRRGPAIEAWREKLARWAGGEA
jgi:glycosyltransferase involved in cell wall biosynthesis